MKNPDLRPSISEIKRHSFFDDVDWEKVHQRAYNPPNIFEDFQFDNVEKDKVILKKSIKLKNF